MAKSTVDREHSHHDFRIGTRKKGQADETVDCQYQAGDHSNHKNGEGEERGHAVITVDPHCPPQFRSQMATDDSLERVSDLNGGELREGTHS